MRVKEELRTKNRRRKLLLKIIIQFLTILLSELSPKFSRGVGGGLLHFVICAYFPYLISIFLISFINKNIETCGQGPRPLVLWKCWLWAKLLYSKVCSIETLPTMHDVTEWLFSWFIMHLYGFNTKFRVQCAKNTHPTKKSFKYKLLRIEFHIKKYANAYVYLPRKWS